MKVLVTGATGFIGRHLCKHLLALGHEVTAITRSNESDSEKTVAASHTIVITDIKDITASHLKEIDVVIHLAGVAHDYGVKKSTFERVNVEGTRHLAECCLEASIEKLVFISSVKAIAENSETPLRTNVHPTPQDNYGKSKLAAENLLLELSNTDLTSPDHADHADHADHSGTALYHKGMETLIVRIPLVYGEGVKGNFEKLVNLVRRDLPLIFLSIQNKRSYLGIQNLCDFLANCVQRDGIDQKGAKWENLSTGIYHVSDGPYVSFAGLVRSIAVAMGKTPNSYWIPRILIVLTSSILIGRSRAVSLFSDLELDAAETFKNAQWVPPYDLQRGLNAMLHPVERDLKSWYGNLSKT